MEASRFAHVGTQLSTHEQLCTCVKWDLVDRDFFIFSNLVPRAHVPFGQNQDMEV